MAPFRRQEGQLENLEHNRHPCYTQPIGRLTLVVGNGRIKTTTAIQGQLDRMGLPRPGNRRLLVLFAKVSGRVTEGCWVVQEPMPEIVSCCHLIAAGR